MPSSLNTAYLVLAGVMMISVATLFVVLRPLTAVVGELRGEIATTQRKLAEREDFLRALDQKVAILAGQSVQEGQLNVVLPVTDDTQDVVRLVHQAAVAAGGAVQRLDNVSAGLKSAANARAARAAGVSLPASAVPLGFDMDFSGSYQQLRVFLGLLERSPRLLDILRLEIQRNVQIPDSVTAHITAQFYRYEQPKE